MEDDTVFIKYTKQSFKKDSMEIYLYSVLKTLETQAGFTIISIKQLLEFADLGRSAANKIEQALNSLIGQRIIGVYDAVDLQNKVDVSKVKPSDTLYIKVFETVSEGEPFLQIFTDEILKFMQKKMKGIKADIFKQFLYLMGFVNQNENYRKISFPTIERIAEDTNVSNRTVRNYTAALKEHGFLYSNTLILGKEKIKNVYSRLEHAQDVDDAIAEAIAKGTEKINNIKGFKREEVSPENPEGKKDFNTTMKKPELILEVDKQIQDTFKMYQGELNDQSLKQLKQFQGQCEVDVLVKAIHIAMDGKKGLKNPTGFILKELKEGKVIEDAKYQIRRAKENSERLFREDNMKHVDYKKDLRKKKERERVEENQNVTDDIKKLLGSGHEEKDQPSEEWMVKLGFKKSEN